MFELKNLCYLVFNGARLVLKKDKPPDIELDLAHGTWSPIGARELFDIGHGVRLSRTRTPLIGTTYVFDKTNVNHLEKATGVEKEFSECGCLIVH